MRDLVLAKQFEEVIFAVKNLDGNINDKIPYKKLSHTTFVGIPLTSTLKEGSYFFQFNYKQNKTSTALFNQIRVFDIRRADYFSGRINTNTWENLNKALKEFLL